MFAAYARFIIRFRYPVLLLWLAVLAVAVSRLPSFRLDTSIHPLLEASKDQRAAVVDFRRALPPLRGDFLCAVEWGHLIGQAELEALAEFEACARGNEAIGRAFSLGSVMVIDRLTGMPLPTRFRDAGKEQTALERVERHPMFAQWLLSEDGRAAVVLMNLKKPARMRAVMAELEAATPPGTTLHFFSGRMVEQTVRATMLRDLKRGLVIEVLTVGFVLALLFRTVRGVAISLGIPCVAVVLFLGLSAPFGSLSILEIAVPGLLLVIGLCDAIHLVCAFEETRREVPDRHEAVVVTMDHVGSACLWTSVTTAIGFLSLLTADHAAVRDLARTAALGVGLAFAVIVTLVPLLLALWPVSSSSATTSRVIKVTRAMGKPSVRAVALVLLAVSAAGVIRLNINSRWLEELPAREEVVRALNWYEEHIGGLLKIELHVTGPVAEPGSIRALEALQAGVLRQEGVTRCESFTLSVREIAGPSPDVSNDELTSAVGLLTMAGALFPKHLLTEDLSEARLCFAARDMSTNRYLHLKQVLEAEAAKLPAGLTAEVAGYELMAHESSRLVVTTMLRGFVLTLVAVCVLIGIVFRSWRAGAISVLPNAVPILCALGVTGWLGIDLRIGVVMVFCVGVGLAVDDTIHLLQRFICESRLHPSAPVRERVDASLRYTGSALFVTSAVLLLGALCNLPAGLRSLRETGIILAVIVFVAYVADVAFLPRLIVRYLHSVSWGKAGSETNRIAPTRDSQPPHSSVRGSDPDQSRARQSAAPHSGPGSGVEDPREH